MDLYLDSACPQEIAECVRAGIIRGVTLNQSLLAKLPKCDPYELFKDICHELADDQDIALNLPCLGDNYGALINSADAMAELQELHTNTHIKVPVSWANLQVISDLACGGWSVNATCVFSVYQADLAVRAGASTVSAFVGRMNDVKADYGYQVLAAIKKRLGGQAIVLAGSIRNEDMVAKAEECGADVCTVSKSVLEAMSRTAQSDTSILRFNQDFEDWQAGHE